MTSVADKLKFILKPFIVRRCVSDMNMISNQGKDIKVSCCLSERQDKLYKKFMNTYDRDRDSDYQCSLKFIYKLQEICNHPNLYQRRKNLDKIFTYDPISLIQYLYGIRNQKEDQRHQRKRLIKH